MDCKFQLDTFLVIFLYQQGSNDLWDKVLAFYCHLHHPHNGSVLDMLNRQQDQLCCCESNKYKKKCVNLCNNRFAHEKKKYLPPDTFMHLSLVHCWLLKKGKQNKK